MARVAGDHHAQLVTVDIATVGRHARHLAVFLTDAGDLAFLDHVHAHIGTGPRIAPGHRIMACRAATALPEPAQNRVAWPVDIDDRHQFLDLFGPDEFGLYPLQRIGMGRALVAAHLVLGLRQHDHATRAEHDVIVQILAHRLVKRPRLFIDRGGGVLQVVGPDDRGVAARVAAPEPAFFQNGDIGDAEVFTQVIGRRQTMPPGPDDDHVIAFLRLCIAPGPLPAGMMAQGFAGDGKG